MSKFGSTMQNLLQKWLKLAKNQIKRRLKAKVLFVCAVILMTEFTFPQSVLAKQTENPVIDDNSNVNISVVSSPENTTVSAENVKNEAKLKVTEEPALRVKKTMVVTATAYTSAVEETDDTPCITANGFNVCENNKMEIVAANFLPFGAKIRIPEYFGDQVFVVADRMNARYTNRVDIWHFNKADAFKFGVRKVKIEILETI